MSRELIKINGEKLAQCIYDKGVNLSQAGKEMGYSDNYFSWCRRKNVISKGPMLMLDKLYGIKYEDYKINEFKAEERKQEEEKDKKLDEVHNRLYKTIYGAMIHALQDYNKGATE